MSGLGNSYDKRRNYCPRIKWIRRGLSPVVLRKDSTWQCINKANNAQKIENGFVHVKYCNWERKLSIFWKSFQA
jgi:hypothetical protein